MCHPNPAPFIFLVLVMVLLHARVHRNLKEVAVFRHSSKKVNKEDGTVLESSNWIPIFFYLLPLQGCLYSAQVRHENVLGRVGATAAVYCAAILEYLAAEVPSSVIICY